jgi:type IV fimbrial biogenesis protein FimT
MQMSASKTRAAWIRRHVTTGFTLVELIITITIVAILVAVALPNFHDFIIRSTVNSNANELVGALNTARAEAVKRCRPVAVIANGGDWNAGWQVVVAKQTAAGIEAIPLPPGTTEASCNAYIDNAVDAANTTRLCPRYQGPLPATYTIRGKGTGVGAVDTRVVFGLTGAVSPTGTSIDFSVLLPVVNANPLWSHWVRVSQMGVVTNRRDVTSSPAGT